MIFMINLKITIRMYVIIRYLHPHRNNNSKFFLVGGDYITNFPKFGKLVLQHTCGF